jgi:large subunit ribosomal protein L28
MARVCQLTGKKPQAGNNISHANNHTRRRWHPNLKWRRVWVPELGRTVRLRLSTRAIRTLSRKGLLQFLRDEGLTLQQVAGADFETLRKQGKEGRGDGA